MSDGRGGFREGSGRKPSGKKKFQFWITQEENEYLRLKLFELRKSRNPDLVMEDNPKEAEGCLTMEKIDQPIMKLECGGQQMWGNGADSIPVLGEEVWCVHCQKYEKVIKIIPNN